MFLAIFLLGAGLAGLVLVALTTACELAADVDDEQQEGWY